MPSLIALSKSFLGSASGGPCLAIGLSLTGVNLGGVDVSMLAKFPFINGAGGLAGGITPPFIGMGGGGGGGGAAGVGGCLGGDACLTGAGGGGGRS